MEDVFGGFWYTESGSSEDLTRETWDLFASAGAAVRPTVVATARSFDEAGEVDRIEREIASDGGSSANTLADLVAEMLGSGWHGQAAGTEDLARESE